MHQFSPIADNGRLFYGVCTTRAIKIAHYAVKIKLLTVEDTAQKNRWAQEKSLQCCLYTQNPFASSFNLHTVAATTRGWQRKVKASHLDCVRRPS